METPPALSVIIPAWNEALRIEPTVRETARFLSTRGLSFEVLVVDDGSADDTARVVDALAGELTLVRCLREPHRGKGAAVRAGMRAATGARRLFMDADHSIGIENLPRLWSELDAGADLAIASRFVDGARASRRAPWYRRAWSRLGNTVVRAGLITGITDTQCGFKLFTAPTAERLFGLARLDGWGFDLELLALAQRLHLRIAQCGVVVRDDPRSRVRPIHDALAITGEFLRLRAALRRGDYGVR